MTKPSPEAMMAEAVVTARESCGLSRSELARELAAVGLPPSSAWRMDHVGRVSATERDALVAILVKRRDDLARQAATAQAAIDNLSKLDPTVVVEPDEPAAEEAKPTKRPAKAAPASKPAAKKPAPGPRSRKAAATS